MNGKSMLLKPRMSEKAYATSQAGVYVIDVPRSATKHSVASAVTAQFGVKVRNVNIVNTKGKTKRIVSVNGKRMSRAEGRQNDRKKAYITLEKGKSLPFFEAVEEAEEKQQATQEKVAKAIEKQTEKESKPTRRGFHLPTRRSGARGGDK